MWTTCGARNSARVGNSERRPRKGVLIPHGTNCWFSKTNPSAFRIWVKCWNKLPHFWRHFENSIKLTCEDFTSTAKFQQTAGKSRFVCMSENTLKGAYMRVEQYTEAIRVARNKAKWFFSASKRSAYFRSFVVSASQKEGGWSNFKTKCRRILSKP